MIVCYNDPDEYLDELRRDLDGVERKILRLTVRRRYGNPFVHVSVVATALVAGRVVQLEQTIGEAFAGDERAGGLGEKTRTALDKISAAAVQLGLEVRAGILK
jgi:hypothetical protein